MQKFKKIIHIKLTIIALIVVPLVIVTLITSRTNLIAGIRSFVVLTGSMQPTIPTGSIVYVQTVPEYKENDIIAFTSDSRIITHRIHKIIEKKGSISYQTKGDANNAVDTSLVPSGQVLGKSFFVAPYIGNVILFVKTIPGFILLIALPTIIFIGFELHNIKSEIEKEVEKKLRVTLETT